MEAAQFPFDARAAILGCALLCVVLVLAFVRHCVIGYRRNFIVTLSTSLRRNFIVANPQRLFVLSALLTLVAGSIAYHAIGVAGLVAAILASAIGPRAVAAYITKRRIKKFVYQLPDALLALVSALKAGSNLTRGLELLATRQPAPLSQEFTIVLAEYRVGRQLSDSLADLRKRIDTPELDLMSTAMNVSRRVGGNLADTLETLAKTLQEKAHMEGKIDALTSMGRAQGWVVGVLPLLVGLVLYQQQPERMSLLFTQWYGWIVLAVVGCMMTLAAWMIRRIVSIDV
jgi:tight adherence protein B